MEPELEEVNPTVDAVSAEAAAVAPTDLSWYRGDLNGAYQKWRDEGSPTEADNPLFRKVLFEANLFAERMALKEFGSDTAKLDFDNFPQIRKANERSIERALTLHDPDRPGAASFTTYLNRAVANNIFTEYRRLKPKTLQSKLLRLHGGNRDYAHWWIDEEREEWADTKHGLDLIAFPVNIKRQDRPLAHWLLDQDLRKKITWRHVLAQFPAYKTEDTSGRALKRVKEAINKVCRRSQWL